MKAYIKQFSTFLLLIVLGSSCDDYLSEQSPSVFTENTLFFNLDFAEKAVFAAYEGITSQYVCGRFLNDLDCDSDIEFKTGEKTSALHAISHYEVNPTTQYLDGVWTALYSAVERANICIDNLPVSALWTDEETAARARHLYGEAVALRAFCYSLLIRYWGDVPFVLKSTQGDSDFFPPKTDRDSIYEYIIQDLKDVEQYVPWMGTTNETQTTERISKGFVKGLRVRLALHYAGYSLRNKTFETRRGRYWQEYYEIARQECMELIESGHHQLNPSFENIFRTICAYSMDLTHKEVLFELAFGKFDVGYLGANYYAMYHPTTEPKYGRASSPIKTSFVYYYSFDRTDTRRNVSVELYCYNASSQQVLNTNDGYNRWDLCKYRRSWIVPLMGTEATNGTGVNKPVMRYADIFLMLAESENELNGPTAVAKEALSAVRRRAFAQEFWPQKVDHYVDSVAVSKEAFFNALVDERAWELSAENIRKADLVRWNLLGPEVREMKENAAKILNDDPKYATLVPNYLFWKRAADPEYIEILNPDYRLPGTAIAGYTRASWLSLMSATAKNNLLNTIYPRILSGYDETKNNHLYPIHEGTISASNSSLSNDQVPE